MLNTVNTPQVLYKHISQLVIGDVLANLGEVLEIEHHTTRYSLVVLRLNEKQVIKYDNEAYLLISTLP